MNGDRVRNFGALAVGLGLIILGVLFLLGAIFRVDVWGALWPFFIIVPGLLFFVAMVSIGRPGAPLAVPGSIITTVGLILFFQNVTGLWSTWAYAWALIFPTSVGIGIAIAGLWSDDTRALRGGTAMAGVGSGDLPVLRLLLRGDPKPKRPAQRTHRCGRHPADGHRRRPLAPADGPQAKVQAAVTDGLAGIRGLGELP